MAAQPGILQRLLMGLPRMVQGGIDAAATPNTAFGGPTDIMRALQNSGQLSQQRDIAAYEIHRQQLQDLLARNKDQLAQQDELRKQNLYEEQVRHQQEMDRRMAEVAKMGEQNKQASEIGSFTGPQHGGEFPDANTQIMATPLQLPPQPAPQSAVDLPIAPSLRPPLNVLTPPKEGYQFEPSMPYDPQGTRRSAPTAQTLAGQNQTAKQANWPTVQTPEEAAFTGAPVGSKVDPETHKAWYDQHKQDTKPAPGPNSEYEGVLREFTGANGVTDFAKANAEWEKRQVARKVAERVSKEPSEAKAKSAAINNAFAASGNNWNTVLDNVRNGKFPDYAADIADHAQKMMQLPTDTQRKVSAADATIAQVQQAIAAIDEVSKNHPELTGGVGTGNILGAGVRKFQTITGTEPADIGAADAILETTAALQPGQHNFRSVGALADFKKAMGIDPRTGKPDGSRAWLVNPEKAKAALKSIADFNQRLKDETLKNAGKQQPQAAAAAAPSVATHRYNPQTRKIEPIQ